LTGTPQGGIVSPLLANIYLSVMDRHFSRIWDQEMPPPWRRQYRRRTGRPNFRLVRYADDFVVLVHGTKSEAEALKAEIGELLARKLKMTLSDEKTHITHIDDGFVFLGFHIQRRTWGDRRVVLTIPSKQALASVMHKIKQPAHGDDDGAPDVVDAPAAGTGGGGGSRWPGSRRARRTP
ncbi:reverse transcriptase domain-containing protein, partial [Streptomyces sp. NBRC 110611]|uniref:reverse transcriptase domain-containing protein n=1 Tax=Streptomyces sp. NBRC 110611 TaxID=1621259 RepID=UPI000B2349B2